MNTNLYAALTLALSFTPLLRIALRDPKRLRSLRSRLATATPAERRWLATLTLLPGVALCLIGQWPAFLIWIGGVTAGGWTLALWFSRSPPSVEASPSGH
ncbi:MAG TPA: hypothetical protein VGE57_06680 [Solimonas sp.]